MSPLVGGDFDLGHDLSATRQRTSDAETVGPRKVRNHMFGSWAGRGRTCFYRSESLRVGERASYAVPVQAPTAGRGADQPKSRPRAIMSRGVRPTRIAEPPGPFVLWLRRPLRVAYVTTLRSLAVGSHPSQVHAPALGWAVRILSRSARLAVVSAPTGHAKIRLVPFHLSKSPAVRS